MKSIEIQLISIRHFISKKTNKLTRIHYLIKHTEALKHFTQDH
mgnify:CR=1 FL=1